MATAFLTAPFPPSSPLTSVHRSETMGYESSGFWKGEDESGPCQQLGRQPHTTAAILNRPLVDARNPSKSLSVFFSMWGDGPEDKLSAT